MNSILQTALAEAINSLASFFGTTTEAIAAHAPEYLAKYGWMYTIEQIPKMIFLGFLLGVAIYFIVVMVNGCEVPDHPLLVYFSVLFICISLTIGIIIAKCAVAPEIVGAQAILELLKSSG